MKEKKKEIVVVVLLVAHPRSKVSLMMRKLTEKVKLTNFNYIITSFERLIRAKRRNFYFFSPASKSPIFDLLNLKGELGKIFLVVDPGQEISLFSSH